MEKFNSIWYSLFFILCFQTSIFSQINNTSLPATANPSNLGSNNTALGSNSMQFITGGSFNIAIGTSALKKNTIGEYNLAIGHRTLDSLQIGSNNIAAGHYSLGHLRGSSNNNIAIGKNAGNNVFYGSNNVFIGHNVKPGSIQNLDNQLFIGTGESNFPLIRGDFSTRNLRFNVIQSESSRVEINPFQNATSGLRFMKLKSTSAVQTSNGKVLSVNADGDVILVSDQVGTGGGVGNTITAGNNISVNLTGTNYTISSDYENIYTHDGTLTADRTMDMADYNLHFNTSNSPSNGKIYIGDAPDYPTATGEYKLYVEGGILTEKVKVALRSTANWADYVFADDYQLKSLQEVETFIKANKHLPGIESAQELVEKGLDLGEMQAKQMGKIEELTLYIIEQDKKLEQQSKDIEELKALVKILMEEK